MTTNSRTKDYNFIWEALKKAKHGSLTINLPNGEVKKFGKNSDENNAEITINSYGFIDSVITGGDVALGEGYIKESWSTPDLPALLTYFTLNAHALEKFFHAKKFKAFLLFLRSFFNKNTKRGSKKNIKAHYDLGNEFYQLWLDESMTYSSALFNGKNCSLEKAQEQKYQEILSKLNKGTILEIGCGWGGFAQVAAQNDHKIICLTISARQRHYALERAKKLGLQNLLKVKLQDYREEEGSYDNVVSIEMFEAVGATYWEKYFSVVKNNLREGGKAVLQIITIDEQVFADYVNRVDFIQKHIFPGGILPSKTVIRELAKTHGFEIKSELAFGDDYAKTLEIWLENFDAKYAKIKKIGFDDEFIRKWRFYLAYCIAGFRAKRTDVVQFELVKL